MFVGIEDDKTKFAQGKKTTNAPYRRIQNYGEIKVLLLRLKKKNWQYSQVSEKLNDNSFESKAGFDTWGAKVNN